MACLLAFAYWQLDTALQMRSHAELLAEREIVLKTIGSVQAVAVLRNEATLSGLRADHAGLSVAVLPLERGDAIVGVGTEVERLLALDLSRGWTGIREFDQAQKRLAVAIDRWTLRDGSVVRVATAVDRTDDRSLLVEYRWRLVLMWIAAITLIGGLAGLIARVSLNSLRRFTLQVSSISAHKLGRRITLEDVPVELRELATTFNDLLGRLDDAFRRIDTFSADIAHELRSPVANLVTRTHLVLSQPRAEAAYREALESNAEELERLRRMVDDMLLLARAQNPATTIARQTLELRALGDELAEFFQMSAEDRGLRIEVTGSGVVVGDRDLVRRAISNLLSNALRYGARGTVVRIAIACTGAGATRLEVSNVGPVVAADLRPRIFERFVRGRLPAPHTKEHLGAGLGLAIVRSIMHLHGGTVGVETATGGVTTFWLQFPQGAR